MNLLTLTNLRNDLFNVSEKIEKNDDIIIIGKKGKKSTVLISYKRFKELSSNLEKHKKVGSFKKFGGLLAKSKLSKLSNKDLENEIRDFRTLKK